MAALDPESALARLAGLTHQLREATHRGDVRDALARATHGLDPPIGVELPDEGALAAELSVPRTARTVAGLLVPILRYGSQPVGALRTTRAAGEPGRSLLSLLEAAADIAAAAIGQIELQQAVLRRSLELALLNDLSRRLNETEEPGAAVQLAADGFAELAGPVELGLYQLREGVPALVAWTGPPEVFPATVKLLDSTGRAVFGAGRAQGLRVGSDVLADRPTLVQLLRAGGRLIGALVIRRGQDGPAFPEDQAALASALADHLAIALHKAELLAWSRHQAAFDDLTGLASRRHFLGELRREIERVRRQGSPLSMLMVDADHFKAINDTYGHAAGDAVLVALAETLKDGTRTLDIVGRLGGEELGVLLPSADIEAATMVAERLRSMVADLEVDHHGVGIRLTVSIGAAEWDPEVSLEDLVEMADAALYASKAAGRNRVTAANPLATIDATS